MMTPVSKPCVLMILDGWGINPDDTGNAVAISGTPFLRSLTADFPHTQLRCSGEDVGLPAGIMGNSEVGHLNIGAGRIVYQDLLRIDRAIAERTFFDNDVLADILTASEAGVLHLMGLVSDGGVHSQLTHLMALVEMAKQLGVRQCHIHAIMDGRDTPPQGGQAYLRRLQAHLDELGYGRIVSICGRFYAMDRDQRWDRTHTAYRLYTQGDGRVAADPDTAMAEAYARGETDEFITPVIVQPVGETPIMINDGDSLLFFNFRADRARQITRAFTQTDFDGFERDVVPDLVRWGCMTRYDETFELPVVFPPNHLSDILGEIVSRNGRTQLRIAETEKYAHVTYFFNGGEEAAFDGEERVLVPSPRDVATYDLKPAMSAEAVTDALLARLDDQAPDLVVLNFANMDMVGHTGIVDAAVAACTMVDTCVARIVERVQSMGGVVMITADHGNSEKMIADDGQPHTAHTTHPVPFILVAEDQRQCRLAPGRLADIAPTILSVMGIEPPEAMTGVSLIHHC